MSYADNKQVMLTCPFCTGTGISPFSKEWTCPQCEGNKKIPLLGHCAICKKDILPLDYVEGWDSQMLDEAVECTSIAGYGSHEDGTRATFYLCDSCHDKILESATKKVDYLRSPEYGREPNTDDRSINANVESINDACHQ